MESGVIFVLEPKTCVNWSKDLRPFYVFHKFYQRALGFDNAFIFVFSSDNDIFDSISDSCWLPYVNKPIQRQVTQNKDQTHLFLRNRDNDEKAVSREVVERNRWCTGTMQVLLRRQPVPGCSGSYMLSVIRISTQIRTSTECSLDNYQQNNNNCTTTKSEMINKHHSWR